MPDFTEPAGKFTLEESLDIQRLPRMIWTPQHEKTLVTDEHAARVEDGNEDKPRWSRSDKAGRWRMNLPN